MFNKIREIMAEICKQRKSIQWFKCSIGPKYVVSKEMSSQKRNTQNLILKEENSSRFYSWGLQWTVVKKSLFNCFLPRLLSFLSLSNVSFTSSSWRWRRRCYRWPVDTFISVELLTGWIWHGSWRRGPLLDLFGNLPWTAQISLLDFLI